jgi:hypothetical protein
MSQQQQTTERQHAECRGVYNAINRVMADLASVGISKDQKNDKHDYKFRGIDDAYNALAPIMSKHGLVCLPRVLERETFERQTKSGGTLFYVAVAVEYDLVSADDGSRHTVRTYGEAMDSADKATNKAMSAAYKYMAFQTFCIPTVGDNDADATTHDVKPKDEKRLTETTVTDHVGEMGVTDGEIADLMASMDEAETIDELRERTRKAKSVAGARKDHDAEKKLSNYGSQIALSKFGAGVKKEAA